MSKLAWIAMSSWLLVGSTAVAQTGIPDIRGTWKGDSESIILGTGNAHHAAVGPATPRLNSIAFTLTVDRQDGRRFSGSFTSARGNDTVIAVISQNGTIYMVDDDGFTVGTVLAPNRLELCFMALSSATRIASCTVLTKQP
jgi:hypothetical protein